MKNVTKEQATKWLDGRIAAAKRLAVELKLGKDAEIAVCGAPRTELHVYSARNVEKLAELMEIPFEFNDPWNESYPDNVEVAFMYKGWRIFGLDTRREYYNEEAEVAD